MEQEENDQWLMARESVTPPLLGDIVYLSSAKQALPSPSCNAPKLNYYKEFNEFDASKIYFLNQN